jgi:prepilin-type N-terminal cleavage/methylation domain-containing protein
VRNGGVYNCRGAGFTLVELLLAIVIFSMVVSMTYAAYNTTFKVIGNARESSKYGERARIALSRLSEDLGSLYLRSSAFATDEKKGSIEENRPILEFRSDFLRFSSTAHLRFNRSERPTGHTVITYSVDTMESAEKRSLYRADAPFFSATEDEQERGFVLCHGLSEVAFSYIDEDGTSHDSWNVEAINEGETVRLPKIVQLRLGFADEQNGGEVQYFSTAIAIPDYGRVDELY